MGNTFWSDFLTNFLANFLSDVIVGVVIVGVFLTWRERSQQRKDEKRAELEKAIRYVELLKDEIRPLIDQLPGLIHGFEETGWGREVRVPTPFWDVLQPSGELPKHLRPQMLAALALFYDHLSYAKRAKDRVIDAWLVSDPKSVPGMDEKLRAFVNMTLWGLKSALDFGRNLPDSLDSEIRDLKSQRKTL